MLGQEREGAAVGSVALVDKAFAVGREVGAAFGVGGRYEGGRDALAGDGVDVLGSRRRAPDEANRALIGEQARALNPLGHLDEHGRDVSPVGRLAGRNDQWRLLLSRAG